MDLLQLGTQLLQSKFGEGINPDTITSALSALIGGKDGGVDLGDLVKNMMGSGGLQSLASSWLGDGGNEGISADQITDIFGAEKLTGFASQLGIGQAKAADGLAEVLPQLVDKASSGGNLLQEAGGLFDIAKKLF